MLLPSFLFVESIRIGFRSREQLLILKYGLAPALSLQCAKKYRPAWNQCIRYSHVHSSMSGIRNFSTELNMILVLECIIKYDKANLNLVRIVSSTEQY